MQRRYTNQELLELARKSAARAENSLEVLENMIALLKEHRPDWDWVGIYLLSNNRLVLGPYLGAATDHTEIPIGRGVCGTAVGENRNIIVDDVAALSNYLACSTATRSEIVVLIRHDGHVVGQFDIDSDREACFTHEDEELLKLLSPVVAQHCFVLAALKEQCGTV